jgi:proline iminopeptidase
MFRFKKMLATAIGCCMAIIAQAQPGLKDWFLSTGNWQNDPQIYVCEFGTGRDTVVMLHGGWGGDHAGFIAAVGDLSKQFHFITYDQRGSLRSPFPDSLITFDQHIEDVERLRKELNMEKMTVVGHSMGAVLASAYAAKYPARIKRLVLLAPAGLKNPLPAEEKKLLDQSSPAFQQFLNRAEVGKELEKNSLNKQDLSSQQETLKWRIELYRRMLYDVSKANNLLGGRALYKANVFNLTANTYPASGWNYIQDFSKANYPVSIIMGDHDFLDFGALLAKKWSNELPRMKLQIISKAGHLIWVDQPQEFIRQLAIALKKQASPF